MPLWPVAAFCFARSRFFGFHPKNWNLARIVPNYSAFRKRNRRRSRLTLRVHWLIIRPPYEGTRKMLHRGVFLVLPYRRCKQPTIRRVRQLRWKRPQLVWLVNSSLSSLSYGEIFVKRILVAEIDTTLQSTKATLDSDIDKARRSARCCAQK